MYKTRALSADVKASPPTRRWSRSGRSTRPTSG